MWTFPSPSPTLNRSNTSQLADSMREEAARHGYQVMVVSGELDPAAQDNQVKRLASAMAPVVAGCGGKL